MSSLPSGSPKKGAPLRFWPGGGAGERGRRTEDGSGKPVASAVLSRPGLSCGVRCFAPLWIWARGSGERGRTFDRPWRVRPKAAETAALHRSLESWKRGLPPAWLPPGETPSGVAATVAEPYLVLLDPETQRWLEIRARDGRLVTGSKSSAQPTSVPVSVWRRTSPDGGRICKVESTSWRLICYAEAVMCCWPHATSCRHLPALVPECVSAVPPGPSRPRWTSFHCATPSALSASRCARAKPTSWRNSSVFWNAAIAQAAAGWQTIHALSTRRCRPKTPPGPKNVSDRRGCEGWRGI